MVKTRTRFTDELKLNAIEIWNNILSHKFINEISMDTLPLNKFLFYLRQDHIFLKEFCNFLQNAKEKCKLDEDNRMKEWFDGLYNSNYQFGNGNAESIARFNGNDIIIIFSL